MDPSIIRDPEMIFTSMVAFFVALVTALVFSALFKRFRIPWTIALILGGIVMGPQGIGLFQLNEIVMFLAEIGIIFLMFIAGMETKISSIKSVWKEALYIGAFSGVVPGLVGVIIGLVFGYELATAFLLGIIFTSSSFAVIIPTLESKGVLHYKIGRVIVASTMIQDMASLILLGAFLQFVSPDTVVNLPVLIIIMSMVIAGGILASKYMTPFRQWLAKLRKREEGSHSLFEQELTLVVAILLGVAIIFQFFKLETIVGAFFAGLILAEITRSKILKNKIHILGYGIFIPVFFVTIGGWTNIGLLIEESTSVLPLVIVVLLGCSLTKFFSAYISARVLGFTKYKSNLIGITSVPKLITTLAVVLVGQRLELLSPELVTALIVLSIVSTLTAPLVTNYLLKSKPDSYLK
jgi:Kef-type K+ transport system membrane component KefB